MTAADRGLARPGGGGVAVKICGVNSAAAAAAAVAGGAAHIGLVFYPPSPRAVAPGEASRLAASIPDGVGRIGVFVDPTDAVLDAVLAAAALTGVQLHGRETPARAAAVRARTGLPVMKALAIAEERDLDNAADYYGAIDRLLFDAKPPAGTAGALPGGNALSFDWRLLSGRSWALPWTLSGGLTAANVAAAVGATGADAVDVSSGVEDSPGLKNPAKIRAFLDAVRGLR